MPIFIELSSAIGLFVLSSVVIGIPAASMLACVISIGYGVWRVIQRQSCSADILAVAMLFILGTGMVAFFQHASLVGMG